LRHASQELRDDMDMNVIALARNPYSRYERWWFNVGCVELKSYIHQQQLAHQAFFNSFLLGWLLTPPSNIISNSSDSVVIVSASVSGSGCGGGGGGGGNNNYLRSLNKLGKYGSIQVKKKIADYANIYYGQQRLTLLNEALVATKRLYRELR
jgi:hypothetical protein